MRILVVDDEKLARAGLERALRREHEVLMAQSSQQALEHIRSGVVDLAFIDLQLNDGGEDPSGAALIETIRGESPTTIIIAMTGLEDTDLIARCFSLGASDYLFKPILDRQVLLTLEKAKVLHRILQHNQVLELQSRPFELNGHVPSKAPQMLSLLKKAEKLRGRPESVLIRGETGVGKDVLARYLHGQEQDPNRPYVVVNCAAIPETLAESTLFGHRKGAFSGATTNQVGLIEAANGGDLFLDEVATLTLEIQAKLLRALENREILPVGQTIRKKVTFRLIAATNENLEEMVREKLFREDLLARLREVTFVVPPLRERREDIQGLIEHFLRTRGHKKGLSTEALDFCIDYQWPENIRELRSVISAAALFAEGEEITRSDIESQVLRSPEAGTIAQPTYGLSVDLIEGGFHRMTSEYERTLIRAAVEKTGSDAAAARFLGIPRSTLRFKKGTSLPVMNKKGIP